MAITEGLKLGRYEIRAHLGAGGMGHVYLAQDTSELDRMVAIKLLPAEVAADPAALAKFWLVDAGAAICRPSATAGLSARRPASGRAPPSFV